MSERTMEKARQVVHRLSEWYFAEGGDNDPDSPIDREDLDALHELVRTAEAILRTPRGDVDAKALAALIVHIWRRCKNEGPHYRETDEFWEDFERAYEIAIIRTPRGEGGEDGGEFCHLCGEDFDPRESGTVIGPLGQDDGVPRWYRCPRCARAYDAGYQQGQRDPRGYETADPAALHSDAQGEDRWEDLIFSTLIEAYNEAHAALCSDAQEGEEDALVCASCGEPIGDEPTVIWQDAYTHYRCTPEDAIRDDTPVIRPIDAARRGEGGGE